MAKIDCIKELKEMAIKYSASEEAIRFLNQEEKAIMKKAASDKKINDDRKEKTKEFTELVYDALSIDYSTIEDICAALKISGAEDVKRGRVSASLATLVKEDRAIRRRSYAGGKITMEYSIS